MLLVLWLKDFAREGRKTLGYLRRAGPIGAFQRVFWDRIIAPTLFARPFDFVSTTSFGFRIAGNTQDFIQRRICHFGVWEPALTSWISATLRSGDTFVDVGANIGYYSLLASKIVGPHGRVIALEASPETFNKLERNLELNGAMNVRALNVAAADCARTVQIYDGPITNRGMTTTIARSNVAAKTAVAALSLSEACGPDLQQARIIKIDVEGGEGFVVRGLHAALETLRPDCEFVIEVSPDLLPSQHDARDIISVFRAAGYTPRVIGNDYHPVAYLESRRRRTYSLRALRMPIRGQVDIVFSRLAQHALSP